MKRYLLAIFFFGNICLARNYLWLWIFNHINSSYL